MNININIKNNEDIEYINGYTGNKEALLQTAISIGLKSINMSTVEMAGCSYFKPIKDIIDNNHVEQHELMENIKDTLEDLMSTKQNSSKKGKLGESLAINSLIKRYPELEINNTSGVGHEGDCSVYSSIYGKILYEFKTYNTNVNKEEINKFKRDLDSTNSAYGILISHTSGIVGKKMVDIELYNSKILIYISNAGLTGFGIEMGTELLFCLIRNDFINKNTCIIKYPENMHTINTMLSELYDTINNFSRISNQIMESKIKVSHIFDTLYKQSIDYEKKGSIIINRINEEIAYLPNSTSIHSSINEEQMQQLISSIEDTDIQFLLSKCIKYVTTLDIGLYEFNNINDTYSIIMKYSDIFIGKLVIKRTRIDILFAIRDISKITINGNYEKIKNNFININVVKNIECWELIKKRINEYL